jgi:hypothetical protein
MTLLLHLANPHTAHVLRAKVAPLKGHFAMLLISLNLNWPAAQAIEVFNGVPIDFGSTFLHEKRAMQLHAVLTPEETQIIASAMERIAATVNEAHVESVQAKTAWRKDTSAQNITLRNASRDAGIDPHLDMAVKQIHQWQVLPQHIVFDVDYFLPERVGHAPQIYRDRYALTKSAAGWMFSGHPQPKAIGKLTCQYVNALWVCPPSPMP